MGSLFTQLDSLRARTKRWKRCLDLIGGLNIWALALFCFVSFGASVGLVLAPQASGPNQYAGVHSARADFEMCCCGG